MRSRAFLQSVGVAVVFGLSALGGSVWRSAAGATTEEPFQQAGALDRVSGELSRGRQGAPLVHVFGDYECAACGGFEREVGPILRELADAGRIRLVIHDATLPAHNVGAMAAAAVQCAERMGAGWVTHEALYRQAPTWKRAADPFRAVRGIVLAAARNATAEISEQDLEACMTDEATLRSVAEARERARRFGIAEVPTVIARGNQLRFTSWRALARYIERSVAGPLTGTG